MKHAIVVTTINEPTKALRAIQDRSKELDADFYLIGDKRSPPGFDLPGARYFDVSAQQQSGFAFARSCPLGHYARKNIGYLLALRDGADIIVETDDDNIPRDGFWAPRQRHQNASLVTGSSWCNVYRYFSDATIWPRGLPLRLAQDEVTPRSSLVAATHDCPIQQGLADENPDVDAIYRLVCSLPQDFRQDAPITLDKGVWCPFNSQNTTFWRDAFPLLYLPFHCSFRMTDIWRSFVAQRLAWEAGWRVQFHAATVFQERNEHDLMRDFADEVVGYLHNEKICLTLEDLSLGSGVHSIPSNLLVCYQALVKLGVVGADELALLDDWLEDVARHL